jgi:hypothetical protein
MIPKRAKGLQIRLKDEKPGGIMHVYRPRERPDTFCNLVQIFRSLLMTVAGQSFQV